MKQSKNTDQPIAEKAMKKNHAPTLVDVAREAGVSLKTASRVLNHSANVSQKKAEKIRGVMERLGYRPNELARGLKSRKSAAIGMIVPNLSDPFFSSAIKAAQEEARANGHVVILSSSGGYAEVERREIETLVRRQIDGLVLAPADSREDHLSATIPADLPVVTFDEPVRSAHYDVVTVNNRESARQATAHMIEQHNARNVVAIGARPHLYTCAERVAGYREAMLHAKLTPRACLVEHESQLTPERLEKELFAPGSVDAIFSLNWVCTILALKGLRALGRQAGRDVLLISFDDFELADMLTPSLSAVRQPSEKLGTEATRLLFERLKGERESPPRSLVLPTELVLRESCGCRR
ncbi:MAG TPA: LacI family DNA-binding transcriptional regulator [Terracidiphilus sp.]|nr:LacI family DNA-binding transcriptional regulator [Terracidiphilus sp.]